MAQTIDELVVEIDGDSRGLEKGLKKGQDKMKKFGASLGKVAKVGAVAFGALGGASFAAANKFADTTDRIDKLSQRLGLSREGFQTWEFSLSQSGVAIESLQGGMKVLAVRMQEAAEGAGKGAENFKDLGIAQEELAGLSQEDTLALVVNRFQEMEDGAKKAALAQELLGRSGQEMLPLLNGAAGSAEEMAKQARELGLVIGDESIDAGVKFTDQMDQIKRSLSTAGTQIISQLLPAFMSMADWVLKNMPTIQAVMSTVFNAVGLVVSTTIDIFNTYALPVLKLLFEFIQENWPIMKEIAIETFNTILEASKKLWESFEQNLLPIFILLFNFVRDNWPIFQTIFKTAFDIIVIAVDLVIKGIRIFYDALILVFNYVKETFSKISNTFKTVFDTVNEIVQGAIDKFNDLLDIVKSVIDFVTKAIRKIKEFNSMETSGPQGKASDSGQSPRGRAVGGSIPPGTVTMVGENGPEPIVTQTRGQVQSNIGFNKSNSIFSNDDKPIQITNNYYMPVSRPSEIVRKQKQTLISQGRLAGLRR